jgi:hypothetical protein
MSKRTKLPQGGTTAFIDALMAPQPVEDLVDTDFNRLMRNARRDAWDKADARTDLYLKMLDFFRAEDRYVYLTERKERRGYTQREDQALKGYRAALAMQLRTPAPDVAAVKWKRSQKDLAYIPITEEQVVAAIESDEKFLAAHPTKRPRVAVI